MKSWKVILWLVLFFPVGLYLMFKHMDWSKPIKYGLAGFYALLLIAGGLEFWSYLFFVSSFFVIIYGLFAVFRKKSRRRGIGILVSGILLFAGTSSVIEAQTAEQERIEQQELAAQAKAERLAEEERQAEIARQEEQELIEEEKQLQEQVVQAIEKVEKNPTEMNYENAEKLLSSLENADDELISRLDEIRPAVDEYEVAKKAVEQAETEKDRSTYDEAHELVSALSISNRRLTQRLDSLDTEITEFEEEERVAAEKEAEEERIATEKAAAEEERRIAAEKETEEAERQATQEEATQKSSQNSSIAQPKETQPVESTESDNVGKVVYIAPQSGTKYHYSPNCRGLNNANSVQEMSLSEAESLGYELCGWE